MNMCIKRAYQYAPLLSEDNNRYILSLLISNIILNVGMLTMFMCFYFYSLHSIVIQLNDFENSFKHIINETKTEVYAVESTYRDILNNYLPLAVKFIFDIKKFMRDEYTFNSEVIANCFNETY